MDKVYPSKKDIWIVVVLWLAIISLVATFIAVALSGASPLSILLQAILWLGLAAFLLSVLQNTNYTITQSELLIRTGPFKSTISLESIQSVEPTRKLWSSPALSLDRLHIQYEGSRNGAIISPENKEEFLRDFAERTPNLEHNRDGLAHEKPNL